MRTIRSKRGSVKRNGSTAGRDIKNLPEEVEIQPVQEKMEAMPLNDKPAISQVDDYAETLVKSESNDELNTNPVANNYVELFVKYLTANDIRYDCRRNNNNQEVIIYPNIKFKRGLHQVWDEHPFGSVRCIFNENEFSIEKKIFVPKKVTGSLQEKQIKFLKTISLSHGVKSIYKNNAVYAVFSISLPLNETHLPIIIESCLEFILSLSRNGSIIEEYEEKDYGVIYYES